MVLLPSARLRFDKICPLTTHKSSSATQEAAATHYKYRREGIAAKRNLLQIVTPPQWLCPGARLFAVSVPCQSIATQGQRAALRADIATLCRKHVAALLRAPRALCARRAVVLITQRKILCKFAL